MERTEVLDLMGSLKLYGMRAAYDETLAVALKLIFDSWGWGAARKLLILLVGGADFSNM